ncbi:MAG: hypothetical protein HKO54_04645 [Flavobacteriaceae bacterium]|nr:hypothetical protein [Flavobacteriaceae bacterium]
MKGIRIIAFLLVLPLLSAVSVHKFYVSITKIEHSEEDESLQIISKLFIDDIEDVLQARYSADISLDPEKETAKDARYLREYVLQKLKVEVNGTPMEVEYLGREYENDVVKVYVEVMGVKDLRTLEIENKMLMELFEDQQNIIHVKRKKKRKTLVLDIDNPKGLLNFI